MYNEAIKAGGIAVVTGGASGVGFAAATRFAEAGLGIVIADLPGEALEKAAVALGKISNDAPVIAAPTDVSNADDMARLADTSFAAGEVAVLMNNAGMAAPTTSFDKPENWRRMFEVNVFGVLNGVQAFAPRMIEAARPAVIINTGSKQGITTPPGNPGYNTTKAAIKVMTEMLAHDLRAANAAISAHLFVPGFTYTGMIARFMPEKPASAWTSEQAVDYLLGRVASGDFYVLCPDNDVTEERDKRRVEWAVGDIIENRPALSRWHDDYAEAFKTHEGD